MALLISNGDYGQKEMQVGKNHQGEIWREITGSIPDKIVIDAQGKESFRVHGGQLAVWV